MRKVLAFIMLMVFSVFSFAGCSKPSQEIGPEAPVTMEQVNTDGQYVARAYIESLFTDNRAMFEKCYPEGFLDKLGRASNSDLYDQYRSVMNINSTVLGTASAGHKDYTMENGFDEAGMRASICMITGLDYSAVGLIQIQKVKVFFSNGQESMASDFIYIVFESNGSWYMLESYQSDAEF